MNRYLLIFVMSLVLFSFPNITLAENTTDQVCYGDPLGQGSPVSIRYTLHGQVFRPSVSHISKVAIFARSIDASAKVKIKIQKAWWAQNLPTYEKIVVVNNDPWWVEANFGEAPVTPGADYFMTVEPLNNAAIEWYISDNADCNPSGYAFVGGDIRRDKDFYFLTRGNSEQIVLQTPVAEEAQETPSAIGSANTGSSSSINSQDTAVTNSSISSSQTSPTSSAKSANSYVSDADIAVSNKISSSTTGISDEEVEEILKMIAEDYASRKKGMFGLSGAVGSFLTPTIFYSVIGLILLSIVILIIIAKRRRAIN